MAASDAASHAIQPFEIITRAIVRLPGREEAMEHAQPVHPRSPELSQHFLRPEAASRLVASLPLRRGILVVEIGAGAGALTEALATAGFRVIAIEKDARLFRSLRARFIGRTNVECHHADALTFPLPRGPYAVVANLPYGITSAIVRRLLSAAPPPVEAFLVVQAEAAAKFAGTPEESMFSLLHKPWFDFAVMRRVPRGAFEPRPRVRSAVLRISRREAPLVDDASARAYRRFVASTFGARGDTVRATLKRRLSHRQMLRLARDSGFALSARPSQLTFDQWLMIFRFQEHCCSGRDPAVVIYAGDRSARKSTIARLNSGWTTAVR